MLWRIDSLLGKDLETNNETTAVAKQQIFNKQQLNYNNEKRCFLRGPCQGLSMGQV
jgi:hypothetical protein